MARKSDFKSLCKLIVLIVTIIGFGVKFFVEVHKRGMWKECFLSVSALLLLNCGIFYFTIDETIPFKVFGWGCLISFLAFCLYWYGLFQNNKFSKRSLKQNSGFWSEQAWWWSLDGWQFEQEVAKIFILHGYDAEVTKGSGDGGVDIILKKDDYCAIVQCKHYKNPVPPEPIRALWGCKDDFGADEVILVASSGITQSGADFISNKPDFIVLNLDDIIEMSRETEKV